jgi:hypothetical protein
MSQEFDPYHRWLGIPPEHQPPDHYRLLGIQPFETQPDVIENAADRQMAYLRTFQTGPHAALSQKLLNQVAAAKVCLLNPEKKAAYDGRLRSRLEGAQPAAPEEAEAYDFIEPLGPQSFAPPDILEADVSPVVSERFAVPSGPERFARPPALPPRRGGPGLAAMIGVLAFGLALVIGVVVWRRAGEEPPGPKTAIVLDWPEPLRRGATLEINGKRQWVAATGPLEYPCGPGRVHVLATIPGYRPLERIVTIEAGQKWKVSMTWQESKPATPPGKPVAVEPPSDEEAGELSEDEFWDEFLLSGTPRASAPGVAATTEPPGIVPAKEKEPPPIVSAEKPKEKAEPPASPAREPEEVEEPLPMGKPGAEPVKLDPQVDPLLAEAWAAVDRSDLVRARERLVLAQRMSRDDPRAVFGLGLLEAICVHDWPVAERYFALCAKQQPGSVASLNNLALVRMRVNKENTALRLWETALAAGPAPEEIAQNLGRLEDLVRVGRLLLKPGTLKTLEDLVARAGGVAQVRSRTAFRYMGLELPDGGSLGWPTAIGYEDHWCWTCGGRGEVRCPVPDCARGGVRAMQSKVVGRNPVSGQQLVQKYPVRVPCRVCNGRGAVLCKFCNRGKE